MARGRLSLILGNGDIATALRQIDQEDRLFFASGVSNSSETRSSEFNRERDLLYTQPEDRHIVYFSSLAIFYSDTPYARHKRTMETLIKFRNPIYTIVRIGNITWGRNPNTLINFFRNRMAQGLPLDIQDAYRYLIDKDEFLYWMKMIPGWSCEMNLTGRRMKVAEIVNEYVTPFVQLEVAA